MRIILIGLFAIAACAKEAPKQDVASITIEDLDARLAANDCQAVDANSDTTRKKHGVIPGAVLLSDYDTFGVSELPADKTKTLVFYCANMQCGASHEAAKRARMAGYPNVKVLPEGIAGWVKAGKKVSQI